MKFILFIPAIFWFIISTILLALPGEDLPNNSFFNFPYFDKIVHLIMFFLITILFCYPFKFSNLDGASAKFWSISIALYALVFGIVMEFVQKYFVPGRSFDLSDILFDGLGSCAGMMLMTHLLVKK